ncbi:TPA: RagB/SusD family nutrient uptake outer membrane protein [Elizabethkingia anophelis]
MKKNSLLISLVAMLVLSGCNDYLSELPDNRTVLDTPEKISEILVKAYPSSSYVNFSETMSDNVFDTENVPATSESNTRAYKWEEVTEIGSDTPSDFWDASYSAIAHANQALVAIDESPNKASLSPQRGEALVARAYNHFMLLQFFSLAYNPATAESTPGIPYVKEAETSLIKNYTRQSVKEVMDNIQLDLEEGLKLVGNDYKQSKYHFTKNASRAFATRFYLIKGDWAKVVENTDYLGTKPTGIRDYKAFDVLGIYEKLANYSSSSVETNLLLNTQYSTYMRKVIGDRFAFPGKRTVSTFGFSTNPTGKSWYYSTISYNGGINDVMPKFDEYFKYTNQSAGIGYPFVNFTLLSNDEIYINRLEALVMLNRMNEALEGYNYFLSTRTKNFNAATDNQTFQKLKNFYQNKTTADEFTPFYSLTDDQKLMLKAILEIKRLDFYHEGLRWLDVKRHNIIVTHEILGETTQILKKDDPRRAMQLPAHVVAAGLKQNPR